MTNAAYSQQHKMKTLFIIGLMVVLLLTLFPFTKPVSAHGYIDSPGSRAALCKAGVNQNCGSIIYEPQSLETLKGFPEAGPADGKIASAGGLFPALDEQSSTRWSKVNMAPGPNTFTWKISARHATTSWKYYITNQDWDPNAPLSRSSFDLTPFCSVNYNGQQPPATYSDTCNVPERTGYQVILAVWEVHDTVNAFYNVIDVNFGGSVPGDAVAPTAPSSLAASNIAATSATLTWNASTDNVGVSKYQIYNGTSLIGATANGTTLNYNVTGLTASTAYSLHVKAIDAAGNLSPASNTVTFTTANVPVDTTAPTAPGGLHVMGTSTSNTIPLMWNESTDNVGVSGYRIYQGSTLIGTVSGTTLSYDATGLAANTTYTFTVRAIDAAGNESANSNSINATTAQASTATPWAANVAYTTGTLVSYNGVTYECRQSHTSLNGWEPANVAALWKQV